MISAPVFTAFEKAEKYEKEAKNGPNLKLLTALNAQPRPRTHCYRVSGRGTTNEKGKNSG